MRITLTSLLCALLVWAIQADARNLYVAINGNNNNPGTITQPWRTIGYAVSSASGVHSGDTIVVRQGNYPEEVFPEVSGTATQPIILRRLKNETVSLDPGKIRFESGVNHWKIYGMVIKHSSSSGLEINGTHAANFLTVLKCTFSHNEQDGIYLSGSFGGIQIRSCDIQFNGEVNGVPQNEEGHGIVIYGSSGQLIVKNSLIANNWHKGIAYGSDVTQYDGDNSQIDSNMIINNYESGLDFSPDNSFVRHNYISRNGQRDIESGEWGDKGVMAKGICSHTTFAFNVIKSSGGMELAPLGDQCYYYNNTLYKDIFYTAVPGSPYQSTIMFYDSYDPSSVFRNNIICNMLSQEDHHWAIIAEVYQAYTSQTWSNNLYWAPNSSQQSPDNKPFKLYGAPGPGGNMKTLAEVQATWPNAENNSIYVNPSFISSPDSNFQLLPNSPAIDAGYNVGFPYVGQAPDIGAYEFSTRSANVGHPYGGLFENSGAVLRLSGVGADEMDLSVDPATDELTFDADNGSVPSDALPGMVTLAQNNPNPFNPTTSIIFNLPNDGMVKLTVYSITGQFVKTLVNSHQTAGAHEVTFDGSNLASGVYLYRLEADGLSQTQKMMLTK
jgi:parallel beta-helix repeat protein